MTDTIEKQKAVAESVYAVLKIIDPHCILAGGAPRDWHFGNLANDLDFYFASTATTIGAVKKQLNSVFNGVTLLMDKDKDNAGRGGMYASMPFLMRIWEVTVQDMPVQLIQVQVGKQWTVVDHMDISICQAWYIDGEIHRHQNFKLTEASKNMFCTKPDYSWQDKHAKKIAERFPNYYLSTKEQATNSLLRKVLTEV